MQENADTFRQRELQTGKLHDAQRELKAEQKIVQDLDRELEEVSDKRRRLDADNQDGQEEIDKLTVTFLKARGKNDRLKVEHNNVLANQIFLTARYAFVL